MSTTDDLKTQFAEAITHLREKFAAYNADGFSTKEVIRFVLLAGMTLAKAVEAIDVPGEEKRRFVVEVVTDIYREHDPNIPWIPEPFETMLEQLVLDNVVPALVDMLVEHVQDDAAA